MGNNQLNNIKKIVIAGILLCLLAVIYVFFFSKLTAIEVGPVLNQKAPDIYVVDTNKKATSIPELSGEKGLIMVFFRSADWCPFCKRHLIELNGIASQFKALGYGVSAISYDSPDILEAFSQQENINYSLLSDQQVNTMQAYNIVNAQYALGDENYGIPYPGVVVVNPAGDVVYKYFYEGYMRRVKFADLYQQLSMEHK